MISDRPVKIKILMKQDSGDAGVSFLFKKLYFDLLTF